MNVIFFHDVTESGFLPVVHMALIMLSVQFTVIDVSSWLRKTFVETDFQNVLSFPSSHGIRKQHT